MAEEKTGRAAQRKAEIEAELASIKADLDDGNNSIGKMGRLAKRAKELGEELQDVSASAVAELGDEIDEAGAKRDEYVEGLSGELADFEGAATSADIDDNASEADYLGLLDQYEDPLSVSDYVGDVTSEAAGATADQRGIDAQLDAMNRFKDLSTPTMTAEEKFMMEQARMTEERDRRSVMDAALRDLEARGARSGGAEIAALTGAQDVTSQNRLMGDLGAQANAQKRAMLALQGYGDTAGKIRDSSFNEDYLRGQSADEMATFNQKMMADYNMWKDKFTAGERDAAVDRGKSGLDTKRETTDRRFGRQGLLYNEKEDLAGLGIGVTNQGVDDTTGYTSLLIGKTEADRARAELEDDEHLGGLPFDPFDPAGIAG